MAISREIKVGVFVLLGMSLIGFVVFLIGDQRHLFSRSIYFTTSFNDVQGLAPGAPVRMNGINVGSVTQVQHAADLRDPRIHVRMWIVQSEAVRIRADSKANIANRGLLGDKLLEIVPGSAELPALPPDSHIEGENPQDFANLASQVTSIADKANAVLINVEKVSRSLADDQVQTDLRSSIHAMSTILTAVSEGDGYAHRLLTDPLEADRVSHAVANFEKTSNELAETSSEVRQIAVRINRGPGFAHSVIYSDEGTQAVGQIGTAAGELSTALRSVREGDGMVRTLLYGGGSREDQQILANLAAASRDLRDVMAGVKAGKGTVGALLVDPSVYEDMKVILGNVERNEVLRALVRYSIKRDEARPKVEVTDPAPAGSQ